MSDAPLERLPFQKPDKRIVDRKFCTQYLRQNPWCECGCGKRSREFHHIKSRKMGGSDVEENGLALTSRCHAAWHQMGGRRWFQEFGSRMQDLAVEKVMRALRIEEGA